MALTERTPTTIAFMLLVCGGVLGCALWLNERFNNIDAKQEQRFTDIAAKQDENNAQVRSSIDDVREQVRDLQFDVKGIDAKVTDRVTFSDVEAAFLKLARDNPTLKVEGLKR